MGPRTVVTIEPECIKPGVLLPKKPQLRPALKFNSNDFAHALFFAGGEIARAHLRAARFVGWPFGSRWSVCRLAPTADASLSEQLHLELRSRLNHVRANVEPLKAQNGHVLVLTGSDKLGRRLTVL